MKKVLFALVLVAAMAAAGTAQAAVIIDFSPGPAGSGGTFTISGGNATGVNIPIGQMEVSGTGTAADGLYLVTGTFGSGSQFGSLNFDTVAGTISITGGIGTTPVLTYKGLAGVPNGTELLSGSFSNYTVNSNGLVSASGIDTKSFLLLDALGIPESTKWGLFGYALSGQSLGDGRFTISSLDMRNTAVPEPSSMLLLGSGLIGLAGVVRRRFKK